MTDWVTQAGRAQIAKKAQAIYDVFDNATETIDMKDGALLEAVLMEVINQMQSGQGFIFAADLFCVAKKLSEMP